MADHPAGRDESAGSAEWAGRFEQQAVACQVLGSDLWARLLRIIGEDVAAEGATWSVVSERAGLRFGQAGPLRLVGAAHRLALAGDAPEWAALLPSCGGTAPAVGSGEGSDVGSGEGSVVGSDVGSDDRELRRAWLALVAEFGDALLGGLDREVQTNEVGRAAGLALAHRVALRGWSGSAQLIELGCSGGLNLRLDRFRLDLGSAPTGGVVLGDPSSEVRLSPEVLSPLEPDLSTVSTVSIVERVGIDPHPIDPTSDDGRLTLLSFVWPDQVERFERLTAAIEVARKVPAQLISTAGRATAEVLSDVLAGSTEGPTNPGVATIVQHSIVWQYIPTDQRPAVTQVIEAAGEGATVDRPLVWVRFEPDEWDRRRAAVWARTWPGGGDRLVAHADFHGRWLAPVPAP